MKIEISRASPEDAAVLTEIALAAKRHWGYPESLLEGWLDQITIQSKYISANHTCYARWQGAIAGFYALVRLDRERVILDHLWVRPSCMRRGIGRALFEHAVAHAASMGFARLEIESDPNAAAFYERMGCALVETTRKPANSEMAAVHRQLPKYELRLRCSARETQE